jgi:hypothetical protein
MRYLRRNVTRASRAVYTANSSDLVSPVSKLAQIPSLACRQHSGKKTYIFLSQSMRKFAAACGDGRAHATEVGNQIASCKTIN